MKYNKGITENDIQGFLNELCESKVSKSNTFSLMFHGSVEQCRKAREQFNKAMKSIIKK